MNKYVVVDGKGRNMEEKSLIKTEKVNIFQRIRTFLKGLFSKKTEKKFENVIYKKDNFNVLDELKRENKLMILQREYESGMIKEEELSEIQKQELLSLYKKQVVNLEENIYNYQRIIEKYKCKIIEKRKKLLKNN